MLTTGDKLQIASIIIRILNYIMFYLESKTLSAKFEKILSSFEENQNKKLEELAKEHQSDIKNTNKDVENLMKTTKEFDDKLNKTSNKIEEIKKDYLNISKNLSEIVTKIGLTKNDILKIMMINIATKESINSADQDLTKLINHIINDPKITNPISEFEKEVNMFKEILNLKEKTTMNI